GDGVMFSSSVLEESRLQYGQDSSRTCRKRRHAAMKIRHSIRALMIRRWEAERGWYFGKNSGDVFAVRATECDAYFSAYKEECYLMTALIFPAGYKWLLDRAMGGANVHSLKRARSKWRGI
ncbi:hypothetical protein, partial [Cupriavidus gilardii]|uniref:hypothetical protein n=1 Tax=Cupriavidus gilardii TaxID=82541 RepID=UPI001572F5F7